MISVDRIEGNFAILELENGTFCSVALSDLPNRIQEGDCLLKIDEHTYKIDVLETKKRKEKLYNLQNSIFQK